MPGSVARPLGLFQQKFDTIRLADVHQDLGVLEEQPGPAALLSGRQRLEPPEHGGPLTAAPGLLDLSLDQPRRPLVVWGGKDVPDSLGDVPFGLVPAGGQEV